MISFSHVLVFFLVRDAADILKFKDTFGTLS